MLCSQLALPLSTGKTLATRTPALLLAPPPSCVGRSTRFTSSPTATTTQPFSRTHARSQHTRRVVATNASSVDTPSQPTNAPADYFANDSRPVILYDGVCNLCNNAVNIMLELDPDGSRFRMAALQSNAGMTLLERCGRNRSDISSIVLVEPGNKHYIRSDAILNIAKGLSNPFPLLALFGFPFPPFLRDAMYDQVANNRYSFFGKSDVCRLSNAGQEHRFIVD